MKKIIACLAAVAALASGAAAQTAPEGFIAACPDIPGEQQMIAYHSGKGPNPYESYYDGIEKVRGQLEKFGTNLTSGIGQRERTAMRTQKVTGTNVTLDEAMKMSDAERKKLAKASAEAQMRAMGVTMKDIQALESGNKSEEELVSKMLAKQTGGLTMKDIEAMKHMNDEQRAAFMVESGLAEQMNANAKANQGKNGKNASLAVVLTEIGKNESRVVELTQRCDAICREAGEWGREKYLKNYKKQVDELRKEIQTLDKKMYEGEMTEEEARANEAFNAQMEPLVKRMNELLDNFWKEAIPVWRNAVIKAQNIRKNEILSLYTETGRLYDKAYQISGDPQYMCGETMPLQAVALYLEGAESIENFNFGEVGEQM